nr:MAG TPA: tail tape measure protein [Caudoviricetes sp.]
MASKKLQGITIEINGNTSKLNESLKNVNGTIYKANNELKQLNSALKLDPKNTQLLAEKQDVLKKNIQASRDKLHQLITAQQQLGKYQNLTEEQKEKYRELSVAITSSKKAVESMNNELKKTSSIDLSKIGSTLKTVGNVASEVMKKVAAVTTAVSGALTAVVGMGVKSYASYEQNIGGVETLFKDSADKVLENAQNAYKTSGLSANDYMETVTSFSASLLQSLGGDTEKAANVADMALVDMADNANKFGTDMSSIQNAYQGFAKQNYTMLDNLKLGYGGTKSEMERLLADAQKLTGVKYDINNLSDVYNAIHAIQVNLDVTGTTAKEAKTTISGSAASMKSAFDNFLNGSGSPEALASTITVFVGNITNAITKLAPNILNGIVTVINQLIPQVGQLLINLVPMLWDTLNELLTSTLNLISENVDPLVNTVLDLVTSFINFILDNLPRIIEVGLQIVLALATGITDRIDDIIPAVISVILKIVEIIVDNVDLIIEATLKLMIGISKGIVQSIPEILTKIVILTVKIIKALLDLLSPSNIWDVGKQIVKGIWEGISNGFDWFKKKIKGWVGNVMSFIKNLFGIHSPSRVMRDEVGLQIGRGVANGITKSVSDVQNAMSYLSGKVQTSFNPVINPTTNTNPFILQIDKFVNNREQDVQGLAEEMEFYRRQAALAKGGN